MSTSKLDQLVKGAPPPSVSVDQIAEAAGASTSPQERTSLSRTSDPTTLLPSSPPQIYLNLLILEASLRSQYLSLRARRRQNTFVLLLLGVWIAYSTYLVFLRPREDGMGRGGSPYWVVDTTQKVSFIGGIVMAILFWVTGQWERGIRWPRRWIGVTNRGLRGFNCKVVIIKGPWWSEMVGHFGWLIPYSLVFPTPGSEFQYIDYSLAERRTMLQISRPRIGVKTKDGLQIEEDIAPGGDTLKLLLLPKPFTADFREAWDTYRTEYWGKENERRALLRKRHRARQREIAKQQGGWLWWTGWRGWAHARGVVGRNVVGDVEKTYAYSPSHHAQFGPGALPLNSSRREKPRRPSLLKERGREGSHSRSSSSSTITGPSELEDMRERRLSSSNSGSTADRRRRKPLTSTGSGDGNARPTTTRLTSSTSSSRPTTPKSSSSAGQAPTLAKRPSNASTDSDRSSTVIEEDKATPELAA